MSKKMVRFFAIKRSAFFTSVVLAGLSFVTKAMGFLREVVVANLLGAGVFVDAYVGAFTLIHLGTVWIRSGLYAGGVSLFVRLHHEKGNVYLGAFVNGLFLLASVVAFGCASGILFFSSELSQIFFPGFAPETRLLLLQIIRYFWVFGFFRILCFLLDTYLQALDFQITVRLGWLLQSTILVAVLVVVFPFTGPFAWPLGQSLGQVGVFCFSFSLAVFFMPQKNRLFRNFSRTSKDHWKIFSKRALPGVLSNVDWFFYQIVDRYFTSFLEVGSMACMNYATVLWGLTTLLNDPLGPLLTRFSTHYAKGDLTAFRQDGEKAIRATLWLFITFGVGYLVLLPDLVGFIFVHGKFTAYDAVRTYEGTRILALQAPMACLGSIVGAMMLGAGASHMVLCFAVSSSISNAFMDWLLVDSWGVNGLLFATTVATYVSTLLSCWYVQRRFSWSLWTLRWYFAKLALWGAMTCLGGLALRKALYGAPPWLGASLTTLGLFVLGYGLYRLFRLRVEIPLGWAPEDILARIAKPLVRKLWGR